MSIEILAPAGSQQAMDAAIAAGANAVYFGLPRFGARAYASNFSLEQTRTAIEKLHLAGMKAYITMNTILYEDEMEDAFADAKALYEMGVDALIIQDLGLLQLLHTRIPSLELHASTQLSVSRPEQIEQLAKLGVKRVVLARECTLEQIRACAATGMEIEAFVHGALCISYSGQCQFSAVRMSRSGNRGQCAQPCRMRYTLKENGNPVAESQFMISPKDLSLIRDVKTLQEAGVLSLKIEGRMKSAEYVYESVEKIRKVLEGGKPNAKDQQDLEVVFNRGFTRGHTFGQTGTSLMNTAASNHQGIVIGKVIGIKGKRVRIQLEQPLAQSDGLRFEKGDWNSGCHANFIYNTKGRLISGAAAGDIVEIEAGPGIQPGALVKKTISAALQKTVEQAVAGSKVQIPVTAKVTCTGIGQPLRLTASYLHHTVTVESSQPAQAAAKRASDAALIEKQLKKTGDSFAYFASLEIDIAPGLFFALPVLNELRRAALQALKESILRPEVQPVLAYSTTLEPVSFSGILVEIQEASQHTHNPDVIWLSEFPLENTKKLAHLSGASGYAVTHLVPGELIFNMNVTNSYAVAALLQMGYKGVLLSDELSLEQTDMLCKAFLQRYGFDAPLIVCIYQKRRLMVMKHCPVNSTLKDGRRKNCRLCHENKYILEGSDKSQTLLLGDSVCNMRLYDTKAADHIGWITKYEEMGIRGFLLKCIDENAAQVKQIIEKLH